MLLPPLVGVVACGALIFYDRLKWLQIIGIATSLCGVLAIVTKLEPRTLLDLAFNRGDIIIVANMALMGVYSSYLRRLPPLHWLSFIFVLALISALCTLPFALWEHFSGFVFQPTWPTVFAVLYVAIFPSVIAYAAWTRGVELIGTNHAGPKKPGANSNPNSDSPASRPRSAAAPPPRPSRNARPSRSAGTGQTYERRPPAAAG